jgi:hypothetical protein
MDYNTQCPDNTQCPERQGWALGTKVCQNLTAPCSKGSFEKNGMCYGTVFDCNAACTGLTVSPDGTKCGSQIGSILPVSIL